MIYLVDENNKLIKIEEELYCYNEYNFLNTGDFIKGKLNRYRVVCKEVDIAYGGGVRLNLYVVIDNG